ncbi:MAG: TolC family protein [Haliscomenobacter sp.]|nr:TolC family protein [Haliscomenobacter sp.]MBK7477384.1 TolC family protein [Haliscomenobacter sp.]
MSLKYVYLLGIACLEAVMLDAQSTPLRVDLPSLYQHTLNNSPAVQRQEIQNQIAETARQTARSQFDYVLFADLNASRSGYNLLTPDPRRSVVGSDIQTNDLSLTTRLQRTFRSGIRASVGMDYQRIADSYPFTVFNEEVGPFFADNAVSTAFSISQPLLRGQGRHIVTANEKIAEKGWESQQDNAAFIISGQLLHTVSGYWQYRSASESLAAYQQNEARIRALLEITEQLVAADKKPSGDLIQIRADLKDKERQTILAQQMVFAARLDLGRSLGLSATASESLGQPESPFPNLDEQTQIPPLEALLEKARQQRADLKALRILLEQQQTQMQLAKNNLKPQLDLHLFGRYGGSAMGNGVDRFFRALTNNEGRQIQFGAGLSYQFPLNNNLAQANLLQTSLQISDQQTLLRDQIRHIELNVSIAYNNYLNSIQVVNKARQSLENYETVFANEQYKFQNGLTTLLNLILLQERLTFAELDHILARQQNAVALAQLRFETGTLYDGQNPGITDQVIDASLFYSLPGNR